MPNQVGNNRGTWTSLWQRILMAGDLSENRCDLGIKREMLVIYEKSANPTKIYRSKEVLKVDIEDETSFEMLRSVGDDGTFFLEPMGKLIVQFLGLYDLCRAAL